MPNCTSQEDSLANRLAEPFRKYLTKKVSFDHGYDALRMKILLITRHFPPHVSGGARRPYLLYQGLVEAGCEVRVAAPALPNDVNGIVVPHPQPTPLGSEQANSRQSPLRLIKNWTRANLFLPDADIRWALRAAHAASSSMGGAPDWIITTSPPESIHVAGRIVANRLDCRWIADFRDYWLYAPLLPERHNPLRRSVERLFAKRLLARADILTAVDNGMLEEVAGFAPTSYQLHLPQAAPSITTSQEPCNDAPTIFHAGSFSLSHDDRSIDPALALITTARAINPSVELHLVGRLTAEEQTKAGNTPGVVTHGVVPLENAWAWQARADILLVVAAPGAPMPPGKLAEYQATTKPIIIIGGGDWRADFVGDASPIDQLKSAFAGEERRPVGASAPIEIAMRLLAAMKDIDP